MAAQPKPTELRVNPDKTTLTVAFEGGERYEITAEMLRVMSPSAEVQGHAPDQRITVARKKDVKIADMRPVGNYAVRIVFDDRHDTGIFSWSYLHKLGSEREVLWAAHLKELEEKGAKPMISPEILEPVRDVNILQELYGKPVEAAIQKVSKRITPAYRALIEASPFFMIASAGPKGLDCSPRGDREAAFRLVDDTTLVIPDWKGNNRIDTLSNIVRDPRIAMLFLIPGSDTTIRLNGTAFVTLDADLLASFERDGKHPRAAVVVRLGEIYTQCAKAVMRADLWNAAHHRDPATLPSMGEVLAEVTAGQVSADDYERGRQARLSQGIW